jgi:hypothetical protein
MTLLAGDNRGATTRLGLVSKESGPSKFLAVQEFKSSEFAGITPMRGAGRPERLGLPAFARSVVGKCEVRRLPAGGAGPHAVDHGCRGSMMPTTTRWRPKRFASLLMFGTLRRAILRASSSRPEASISPVARRREWFRSFRTAHSCAPPQRRGALPKC